MIPTMPVAAPIRPSDDEINDRWCDGVPSDEDDHDPARIEAIFDLALRKTYSIGYGQRYSPGDIVTFEIEVFNQGSYVADLIEITDYFPTAAFTMSIRTGLHGRGRHFEYTTVTRILNSGPQSMKMNYALRGLTTWYLGDSNH
jgi:hypothetical protein